MEFRVRLPSSCFERAVSKSHTFTPARKVLLCFPSFAGKRIGKQFLLLNMSTCSMCWMSMTFRAYLDLLDLNFWTTLTCQHPAYLESFFVVCLDLLDLNYLTILACQHLACLDLAWLVLPRRLPWLALLALTVFLEWRDFTHLAWLIWLESFDLTCSSDVFTSSCVYIHIPRRISKGESSSGTASFGS